MKAISPAAVEGKPAGKRDRKEKFAPIPLRALGDQRMTERTFRVLGVIAFHDRFGRNGQGCWAGRKRIAQESGVPETHVSNALTLLRAWGYITSEPHVICKRQMIHRIVYETGTASGTNPSNETGTGPGTNADDNRYRFLADRYRQRNEQVPAQNAKSMNGHANPLSIYPKENNKIDSAEAASVGSKFLGERDCAEARTSEKEENENSSYLSVVESLELSELKYETPRLTQIAGNNSMPAEMRSRAARLMGLADNAR